MGQANNNVTKPFSLKVHPKRRLDESLVNKKIKNFNTVVVVEPHHGAHISQHLVELLNCSGKPAGLLSDTNKTLSLSRQLNSFTKHNIEWLILRAREEILHRLTELHQRPHIAVIGKDASVDDRLIETVIKKQRPQTVLINSGDNNFSNLAKLVQKRTDLTTIGTLKGKFQMKAIRQLDNGFSCQLISLHGTIQLHVGAKDTDELENMCAAIAAAQELGVDIASIKTCVQNW
jgi:hypothetical protein